MTRILREGTPTSIYRMKRGDLPRDKDLRYSFLRWVDLSNFDLSSYDMTNMDIIDCIAKNVILPDNGRTDYLISRRTDWTDATIPSSVSSYIHDLVREVIRQAIPTLRGDALQAAQVVEARLGDYRTSWRDGTYAVKVALSLSNLADVFRIILPMFKNYSGLEGRLHWHINHSVVMPESPDLRRDLTKLRWEKDGKMVEEDIDTDVRGGMLGYDRWAAARMIEQNMKTRTSAPLSVYFGQLHPEPVPFFGGTDVPFERDWFRDRWPA